MIGPTTGRGSSQRYPEVAVVVAVPIDSIGTGGRIRGKRAACLLIRKQDRVEPRDGSEIGLIFPERFTALGFGRTQKLRRCQTPDWPDIHCHDPAAMWVKSNIEFAGTAF